MGRVNRYKKTKSFDPFYKGNKQDSEVHKKKSKNTKRRQKIDLKGADEQRMPKSMKMLLEKAKRMNTKKKKTLKRLDDKDDNPKQDKTITFERKKDEKQKDYFQRIDKEAASAVVQTIKGQQKMSDRRKNHLKKRKEKLKTQKNPERVFKTAVEFSDLKDEVKFGEVASQPPTLTAKPRKGASTQDKGNKSLLLASKFSPKENTPKAPDTTPKQSKTLIVKAKKRKHMTPGEKAILDKERQRVIDMYRAAKKQTISQ